VVLVAETATVSVVVPAYNEAQCLGALYRELSAVCDALPYQFEFIFVNDGSTDETDGILAALRAQDDRVCYLEMSRNFGHQGAISAGLAFAAGDAVIMMDGDLQHPPSLIPRLLECWECGFEVVNTIRLETEDGSLGKKLFSRAFYWVFRALTGFPIERGGADFRLMARAPLDALNELPERHRFIRGLVPWLGFRQTSVTFRAPARYSGQPKFTFRRSARLALEGVTAFGLYPLRSLVVFGLLVAAVSMACGLGALGWHVLGGGAIAGWAAVLICVHFFGGCQLAALGIISEYLGRTLDQVKGRPLYIVRSAIGFGATKRTQSGSIPQPHFALPRGRAGLGQPGAGEHEECPTGVSDPRQQSRPVEE
jgi:dolichol-phosphate mannosyltransferase